MNIRRKREKLTHASISLCSAADDLLQLVVRMDANAPNHERIKRCQHDTYALYCEIRKIYEESLQEK